MKITQGQLRNSMMLWLARTQGRMEFQKLKTYIQLFLLEELNAVKFCCFFMRHYSAKSVHAWEVLEYWIVSNMRTADIFFFDL